MEVGLLGAALMAYGFGKVVDRFSYMGDDIVSGGEVETVSYAKFVAKARTGDLILTSSTAITSLSRVVTKSIWSHCGIVWKRPEDGVLFEWSSHNDAEGVPNTAGRPFAGAQLVPLDYLAADNGAIYWRAVELDKVQRSDVCAVVDRLKYRVGFSDTPEFLAYFGPVMARLFNGFGSGMACSHLVAATYMAANAMALDRHLTQFTPKTFSESGDAGWLVEVAPRVSMVVGFDTSRMVRLRGLSRLGEFRMEEREDPYSC